MKIISLNVWGGQIGDDLAVFLKREAVTTDVFCLQEVFHKAIKVNPELGPINAELFDELTALLPSHRGIFAASQEDDEGLAIFVRSSIPVVKEGDVFVHRHYSAMIDGDTRTLGRNVQYVEIGEDDNAVTIMNFHGLWAGKGVGKGDTPERLEQSRKLRAFFDQAPGKRILVGDFNLEPTTESLAILTHGMRDLIKEFGITSTRSHHYTKTVKFADYAIVSPDVNVNKFEVMSDPVSDHLPLLLDFD